MHTIIRRNCNCLKERISRHIAKISSFTKPGFPRTTRLAYSREEELAAAYLRQQLRDYGSELYSDSMKNTFGRFLGRGRELILTGSHLDTVVGGGDFDGVCGVVASLEAARLIKESGEKTRNSIVVVGWRAEESISFGFPYVGCKGAFGKLTQNDLRAPHNFLKHSLSTFLGHNVTLELHPQTEPHLSLQEEKVVSYIELHIEQGPVLEGLQIQIAPVTAIAGNLRFFAEIRGEGGHSGAVPMNQRKDAGLAAASFTHYLWNLASLLNSEDDYSRHSDIRLSRIDDTTDHPAGTTIPTYVKVKYDVRCSNEDKLETFNNSISEVARRVQEMHRVSIRLIPVNPVWIEPAQVLSESIIAIQSSVIKDLGFDAVAVPSGAGHDAKIPARMGIPTGMFFIRNSGQSHTHSEDARIEDIALGAEVLAETIMRIDKML